MVWHQLLDFCQIARLPQYLLVCIIYASYANAHKAVCQFEEIHILNSSIIYCIKYIWFDRRSEKLKLNDSINVGAAGRFPAFPKAFVSENYSY